MSPQAAAAVFWLSSAFCQVLIFNQLYALEEANNARLGLLLCPAPIQGVWLGKAAAGLTLLLLAQVIFLARVRDFFWARSWGGPPLPGLAALLLVDLGMCALGSLLGALAQGQAARESLLSIVLFPLLTPLLLAGIGVGAQTLGAASPDGPGGWLGVACAFDAVFLGAGLLLFSFIYTGGTNKMPQLLALLGGLAFCLLPVADLCLCPGRGHSGSDPENLLHPPAPAWWAADQLFHGLSGFHRLSVAPRARRGQTLRRRRRGGRAAQRPGPGHRHALGAQVLGRLVDLGPAPDHHPDHVVRLCGLSGAARPGSAAAAQEPGLRRGGRGGLSGRASGLHFGPDLALDPSGGFRGQWAAAWSRK